MLGANLSLKKIIQTMRFSKRPAKFKGVIRLSKLEKSWHSQVYELLGAEVPFWVVETGGKDGAGTNWWYQRLFQEVVEYFEKRVLFVQVGERGLLNLPLEERLTCEARRTLASWFACSITLKAFCA